MDDKIHCLVVDDNPSGVKLIAHFLRKYTNVELQTATDDKQAFKWLNEQSFDLLFTDMDMDTYSGLDMLSALERKKSGKAFLITGSTITAQQINSPVLLGILYKPFSKEGFDQAMEMFLSSR